MEHRVLHVIPGCLWGMQIIFMKDGGVRAPQRVVQKSTAGIERYHKRLQLFLVFN